MRNFSRILCILILGILFIGCSPKNELSTDEGTEKMKPLTNYTVKSYEVLNKEDKIIKIHFEEKDLASIKVNFKHEVIQGYYCIVGNSSTNENTLSGKKQIELVDGYKIRLSKDLEKEIMEKLN
ncbi:hypothetical protein FDF11_15900 [Clostridium botulinum]|nr:hypothetical protein [Clostridium botulinum]NFR14959.1 hypothetical protein [Clostridium botulinum]NFR43613.1 hypothetical protein [Clostridium botulinum]NFS52104.1 hypothetical protein [Clostridium botulinum]